MTPEDVLRIKLRNLAIKIHNEIDINILSIQPETTAFINDKILEFQYTSEGANISRYTKEYSYEILHRFPGSMFDSIKENLEYKCILDNADPLATLLNENSLARFVDAMGYDLLNKPGTTEEKIDCAIKLFLNDVYGKPCISNALVEILGIAVNSDEIELNPGKFKIILRQAKTDDFEKKEILSSFNNRSLIHYSSTLSAIIHIKCYGIKYHIIQNEIDKMIAVLRLFRPASIDYISYSINGEAILWERKGGGRHGKSERSIVLKHLNITKENSHELIEHYQSVCKVIPKYIYSSTHDGINDVICSCLEVGYRHYSDALLRNLKVEEKIMNVVIGLESLLLYESQENNLRFWLRGAKILSFLNHSPKKVKRLLKLAYNVRSSFVHGNTVELEKSMKKFNEDRQGLNSSLIDILDYLRVLIVAIMFLLENEDFIITKKNKREFNKEKFLNIVDDSLIDSESENYLREILIKCSV
jgi:Apea-like HEPN